MKCLSPPRWMEAILLLTLPPRDRETVAGDLHEEFNALTVQAGGLRADLWYARQVLSFLPHHVAAVFANSPALMLLCGFTASCGLWLGAMGLRLRHPGFVEGEMISLIIVLQAAITVIALCFRPVTSVRRTAVCGTLLLAWLAWKALIGTLRGAHLEGYILLIAILLLMQAGMTLRSVPKWRSNPAG
jgi:hypothetical protein